MSNKRYSNYYENKNQNTTAEIEVEETVVEQIATEDVVTDVVETESVPVNKVVEPVTGSVTGCTRLRVRREASTDSDVLCELNNGAKVKIVVDESTSDFYAVVTNTGIRGFCMRSYIVKL